MPAMSNFPGGSPPAMYGIMPMGDVFAGGNDAAVGQSVNHNKGE